MPNRILLCGLNGSGKSTLGQSLADVLGWQFLDIETYWFPDRTATYAYGTVRTREEVNSLLHDDLLRYHSCILASVKGNIGEENLRLFTAAVYLQVPKEIRMRRIYDRSYGKFGERMLPGGDLYEAEKQFLDMAERRTDAEAEDWLATLTIPVLRADGTLPVRENTDKLSRMLTGQTEHTGE